MDREKEFEELVKITGDAYVSDLIQNAGYRKFPVEEFEAWLKEMKNANPLTHPDGCPYPHNTIDFFDDLFAKIKELKNEG